MDVKELIPYLISAVGAITGALALRGQLKVQSSDAADKISKAAASLLDPYIKQVGGLSDQVTTLEGSLKTAVSRINAQDEQIRLQAVHISEQDAKLEAQGNLIRHLRLGIQKLMDQIACLGETPVWTLDEIEKSEQDTKPVPPVQPAPQPKPRKGKRIS